MAGIKYPAFAEAAILALVKEVADYIFRLDVSSMQRTDVESDVMSFVRRFQSKLSQQMGKQLRDPVNSSAFIVLATAQRVFSSKLLSQQDFQDTEPLSFEELVEACPNVSSLLGAAPESIALVVQHDRRCREMERSGENVVVEAVDMLRKTGPNTFDDLCQLVLRDDPRLNSEITLQPARRSPDVAQKSPITEKMLIEKIGGNQTIFKEMSKPVVEAAAGFCCSGEVTFSERDEVLGAAHGLEIGFLKKLGEAELCRQLSVDNALQMLKSLGSVQLQRKLGSTM